MITQKKDFEFMEKMTTKEAEMLDKIYKNVKMGSDSMIKLLAKVENEKLKEDMTAQLDGYEKFASKARKLLINADEEPKEENMMIKMWTSVGMWMNTMTDSTDSHIAEMVVEGSNMGVTDTLKVISEYEKYGVSDEVIRLAKDIVSFEESNIEKMKAYL